MPDKRFQVVGDDESHPCEQPGCRYLVPYDDEPYCFEHSPDSGSYQPGYSYRQTHQDKQ